jgi:hypothetical protein
MLLDFMLYHYLLCNKLLQMSYNFFKNRFKLFLYFIIQSVFYADSKKYKFTLVTSCTWKKLYSDKIFVFIQKAPCVKTKIFIRE